MKIKYFVCIVYMNYRVIISISDIILQKLQFIYIYILSVINILIILVIKQLNKESEV